MWKEVIAMIKEQIHFSIKVVTRESKAKDKMI